MIPGPSSLSLLLAAFVGGAFGAAVGALPSFALTGVLVVAGEMLARVAPEWTVAGVEATSFTGDVAFGPVFGPHVAFGGGAAALAYLATRGEAPTGDDGYHPAKTVEVPLGVRPDVLAVGGLFGVAGHLVATTAGALSLPLDPVALGVVGSALLHRAAFGYSVLGRFDGGVLDMSPFEHGERRADGGTAAVVGAGDGGSGRGANGGSNRADDGNSSRPAVEPWLPHMYRWERVAAVGLAVGLAGAAVAYVTASAFVAFGISAASLAAMVAGVDETPVTHHVTLPASTVVLALVPASADAVTAGVVAAQVPIGLALAAGAVAGLAGALLGECCQRILFAHAETHLDPPAASIVLTTLAIGILAWAEVLPSSAWIALP